MVSIREAVSLNNQGLSLILAGKMENAMETFLQAIEVLYEISCCLPPADVLICDGHDQGHYARIPLFKVSMSFDQVSQFHCSDGLSITPTEESTVDHCTINICNAAILFNLGLIYHKQHTLGGESTLRQALHYYNR